jgi:uncharacterized membrane protein
MTLYNLLKTGHVLSVITWVGGGIMMQFLAARARSSGPDKLYSFAQDAAWTGNHVFAPASGLTLVFGIATALVQPYKWGFTPLWIKLGLLGFFLTAINGAAVLGRLSKKMAALGAEKGPNDSGVQHAAKRLLMAMNIDLVIVLAVIVDMIFKPK